MVNDRNTSFGILGTGALGGLYGGLLAHAGHPVHFLARSDVEHMRSQGLKVESPLGNFHLEDPNVYSSAGEMPPVDVAIVAWKTTANSALADALRNVCHPETIVLVLQNGLNVEQVAADVVGADRVLGGCCFLCSNKVGPGHIHHLDFGAIVFGEFSPGLEGSITQRMQLLTELFTDAGIDMKPTKSLAQARWKKLAWNIPFNGLSVVLNANTTELMENPHTRRLAEDLMQEVRAAALANGHAFEEEHISVMLEATRKMVPYDSSMLLDYRGQRPIEVESIFGNPLRAAQQAGFAAPKIEMLYQQLCTLDEWNRADVEA